MTERAQILAERFERANDELIAAIECLTEDRWRARGGPEGWSVAVTAHHIAADHPILAGFVEAVANGQPVPGWTLDALHGYNAQHAREHERCTKEETVELLRREGAAAVGIVRALSDEQLARAAVLPWEGGPPVSAAQLIEQRLIGHIAEHLASIRAAV